MVQAGRAATFLFKIPLFNRKKATHLERAANVKGFWDLRCFLAACRAHVRGETWAHHRALRCKSGRAYACALRAFRFNRMAGSWKLISKVLILGISYHQVYVQSDIVSRTYNCIHKLF
jgi:hypothetical protein